jgi:hypothetical protein
MKEYCDLTNFLSRNNIRISDLTTMKKYDEFKAMEHSCINFTFHNAAAWAGKDLELRLNQRWLVMRESYDYDTIDEDMRKAAEALELEPLSEAEIKKEREMTEAAVEKLKKTLGDVPVSVDDSAVDRPLELALYLLRHGFRVESVIMDVNSEPEEIFTALQKAKPELKIYAAHGWNMRRARTKFNGKIIGIGQKSAYLNDTHYFVNMTENAGLYGYAGIRRLMELIGEAAAEPKDMRTLIQQKGWNCHIEEGC